VLLPRCPGTGTSSPERETVQSAYERVILDALIGDATLFIRADEVARSWRIVDPLLAYWEQSPDPIPL
jgi:glucose-6-phosphate 1-dehydrogenase